MTDRKPLHKIEAYIDVPEQDQTGSYGQVFRRVPKFSACNRRGYEFEDIDEALAAAIVSSLKEWEEPTRYAERFTLEVVSKYGPPRWKIEVDRSP
jgi:hypothetical protein